MSTVSLTSKPMQVQSEIRQLQGVLPYPISWYLGLSDKEIHAIYKKNLSHIVMAAIQHDEMLVRQRAGLR